MADKEGRFTLSKVSYPFVSFKAGIAGPEDPDQLILALEPEAASYYCRKLPFDMFKGQKGKQLVKDALDMEKVPYMVVDNGGGF